MPHDGAQGFQADMPAIWMLNARIPLTAQYNCNCWPNCGEFDIFETLHQGSEKAKSTLHSSYSGGDSNYFDRPTGGTIRVSIVFDSASSSIAVKVLGGGNGDLPDKLSYQDVQNLLRETPGASLPSSTFRLA